MDHRGTMGISLHLFFHPTGRGLLVRSWCITPSNYFLRVIPTLTNYADIVSDTPSVSIYCIYIYIYTYIHTYVCIIYIYSDILSGIYSGILSGVYSHILSGIWDSLWHSSLVAFSLFGSKPSPQRPELAIWGSDTRLGSRRSRPQRPGRRVLQTLLFLLFAAGGRPVGEDSLEILAPSCRRRA